MKIKWLHFSVSYIDIAIIIIKLVNFYNETLKRFSYWLYFDSKLILCLTAIVGMYMFIWGNWRRLASPTDLSSLNNPFVLFPSNQGNKRLSIKNNYCNSNHQYKQLYFVMEKKHKLGLIRSTTMPLLPFLIAVSQSPDQMTTPSNICFIRLGLAYCYL